MPFSFARQLKMTQKINLHTHSVFCDGKNTFEELIQSAINKGFTTLGFSSHSLYPGARSWHMPPEKFSEYAKTIIRLKEKYSDKINLQLGYEVDFFQASKPDIEFYKTKHNADYIIGAVHYVETDNGFYSVDNSTDIVRNNLLRLYPSSILKTKSPDESEKLLPFVDGKAAVCEYFATERKMLQTCSFHILAHPDLIRKRNNELGFFVENEDWYIEELKATVKEIVKNGAIVEMNTGAIARGVMDDFYPSQLFLQMLYENNVPVCINSDCHNADFLDCAFDRGMEQAKKIGFKELSYPVDGKIIHIPL